MEGPVHTFWCLTKGTAIFAGQCFHAKVTPVTGGWRLISGVTWCQVLMRNPILGRAPTPRTHGQAEDPGAKRRARGREGARRRPAVCSVLASRPGPAWLLRFQSVGPGHRGLREPGRVPTRAPDPHSRSPAQARVRTHAHSHTHAQQHSRPPPQPSPWAGTRPAVSLG